MKINKHQVIRTKYSVIANVLENKLAYHPIVILNNEFGTLYYLKAQTYQPQYHQYGIKVKPNKVLAHLSLVDTKTIYQMDANLFNQTFKPSDILKIDDLLDDEINAIYEQLIKTYIKIHHIVV